MNARVDANVALTHALTYAQMGWMVQPFFGFLGGKCACRKLGCKAPGAHPIDSTSATNEPARLTKWLTGLRAPNVGIATGSVSGIFALRVANEGKESLETLEERHGALPVTPTCRSNRGDEYRIFRLPTATAVKNRVWPELPGIEIKADGDYIVAEPSVGPLACSWIDWELGEPMEIADAPEWLLALAAGKPLPAVTIVPPITAAAPESADAVPIGASGKEGGNSMLEHALFLLQKNLSVFPLGAYAEAPPAYFIKERFNGDVEKARSQWTKQPRRPWKEHQSATPSEEDVRGWWTQHPDANIGIACGSIVVVDADSDESAAWCERQLPHTQWRVRTAKGRHFYYRRNEALEIRNSADGAVKIDVRGAGGYVVGGGSRHASGLWYENEFDDDVDGNALTVTDLPMLGKEHVEAINAYRNGSASIGGPAANLAGFDASRVRQKADGSPVIEGGRNNAAASLAGQHFAQGLSLRDTKKLLDEWNASNPEPLSDDELNTTISSIKATHERNHPDRPVPLKAPPQPARTDIVVVDETTEEKQTEADRIPGVLGQVEDYYNATSIVDQPAFAGVASISLGSVALSRLYVARLGASQSYPSLFLCEVVATGGGKEHAHTVVDEFLTASGHGALIGPSGYTSAAGVFSALVSRPNHLAYANELGRHLAAAKIGKDSQQQQAFTELMMVWSSLHKTYRYRGYATTTLNETQRAQLEKVISLPAITLLGASTRKALFDAIGAAGVEDGFLNRLLFFFGDDSAQVDAFTVRPAAALPNDVLTWLTKVRVAKGNTWSLLPKPDPVVLAYDAPALDVMRALQDDVRKRTFAAKASGMSELWARTFEKATRLALIAAVSDGSQAIGRTHAEWAAQRAIASDSALARVASGNIAETRHGRLCNDVFRELSKQGALGVATGMLAKRCRPYRDASARERRETLDTLLADGQMKRETRKAGNGHQFEYLVATRLMDA
jgi:hypothetical protein